MAGVSLDLQLLNLCAALLLLLSFAMLSQRRIVNLVNLLALQGTVLFIATLLIAWRTEYAYLGGDRLDQCQQCPSQGELQCQERNRSEQGRRRAAAR